MATKRKLDPKREKERQYAREWRAKNHDVIIAKWRAQYGKVTKKDNKKIKRSLRQRDKDAANHPHRAINWSSAIDLVERGDDYVDPDWKALTTPRAAI